MLVATRVVLSRSVSPLLKRAPPHLPHFAPKPFPKSLPCPLWSSSFSSCSFSMATVDQALSSNPLLQDFDFPPFDTVDPSHVRPAIRLLLKKLESDLEELERTVEPTWPKLVVPLEKIKSYSIEQLARTFNPKKCNRESAGRKP